MTPARDEHLCKFGGIGDVADDEFEPVRQLFVPGGEIVVDNYVVTAAAKRMRRMAADISCAPNHQDGQ